MWWDDDTIDRTVTRQFVCNHLIPKEIERLDRPLSFGDGLTDGTYWDWINGKAKKLFLILVDLDLTDQIFGLIDDSWDDGDLPIPLDQVERLELTAPRDEKTERKFYDRQFHYLLRLLQKGDHTVYQDAEIVPLDLANKKHAAGQSHHRTDKVVLPNQPGRVFCRGRIPLGPGHLGWEEFLFEIKGIRNIQNEHLLSYWASYTHQGYGYVLFTPAIEFSLKSLLTTTPSCLKSLDKKVRRRTVMNWILCLTDTVCFLHNRGLAHGNIKPSTVLFSSDNRVFLSDFTQFHAEVCGSAADNDSFHKEAYDYGAPEQWFGPTPSSPTYAHQAAGPNSSAGPMTHAPMRHFSPQAADIFSLGCVILELLSFLFKKQGRPFATHRAEKHKTPGRGGAVPDSSFHKNLVQIESWMTQLAMDASKKDDPLFKGVVPILHVVERMLAYPASERPAARDVHASVYQILTHSCGILEPHCVYRYSGGLDFGIGSLRLSSSSPAGSSSDGTALISKKRSSGTPSDDIERSGSQGSDGSNKGVDKLVQGPAKGKATARGTNDFPGSKQAIHHILARDNAKQWQAPAFEGKSLMFLYR